MTKRNFEAIAAIIAGDMSVYRDNPAKREAVRCLALSLCQYFRSQNPNFHQVKFLTACGFTADDAPTVFASTNV